VNGLDGHWRAAPLEEQPRPVILDPSCRAALRKLRGLVVTGDGKSPWVVCRKDAPNSPHGCVFLNTYDGRFSWEEILSTLSTKGVKSVMIEGGANIINDLLTQRIADVIIVTIAPVFVGRDGIGILPLLQEDWLQDVQTIAVGRDVVVAGRMKK
jgi:2,5-diamino-6-(ribosylamino)-4(3H)-pyrimidinone 5'-phosphate reductase